MIEYRFSRSRLITILAGTALFSIVFGVLALRTEGRLQVYCAAGLALFGLYTPAVMLPRLFDTGVVMRIGAEGIEDRRCFRGLLRWDEVKSFAVRQVGMVRALEVYPYDPAALQRRMPPVARAISWLNVRNGKPAVLIQFQDVEPGMDEALRTIELVLATRGGVS